MTIYKKALKLLLQTVSSLPVSQRCPAHRPPSETSSLRRNVLPSPDIISILSFIPKKTFHFIANLQPPSSWLIQWSWLSAASLVQWRHAVDLERRWRANVSAAEFEHVAAGLLVRWGQVDHHNAAPKRLKTLPDSKDCVLYGEKTNKQNKTELSVTIYRENYHIKVDSATYSHESIMIFRDKLHIISWRFHVLT